MTDDERLRALRDLVDGLDDQLVVILQRRAALGREIGEVKRRMGQPARCPEREAQVLDRVCAQAATPLDAHALRRLFEAILEACRAAAGTPG